MDPGDEAEAIGSGPAENKVDSISKNDWYTKKMRPERGFVDKTYDVKKKTHQNKQPN